MVTTGILTVSEARRQSSLLTEQFWASATDAAPAAVAGARIRLYRPPSTSWPHDRHSATTSISVTAAPFALVPLEILDKCRPQTVQKGISAQFRPKHNMGVEKCDWNEWLMWKWLKRWESAVRDIAKADAPAAKRQTDAVPGKADDVPREYATLHNYLTNRYADIVVLRFDQIEGLLGSRLPDAARTQEEWWTGTYRDGDERSCSDAWILAGMTARPNLLARTVDFECEKGM